MDRKIFNQIKHEKGQRRTDLANKLYLSLRGLLTGEDERYPDFESQFIRQSIDKQRGYLTEAISVLKNVPGYETKAERINGLITHYHQICLANTNPRLVATNFEGHIKKWSIFPGSDKICAILEDNRNPDNIINGFDLPRGFPKLTPGTEVKIIAFRIPDQNSEHSLGYNPMGELYGVRLFNEVPGVPNKIYFNVVRDKPDTAKTIPATQAQFNRARDLLYKPY